ncbi:helix-turn-helix transcriptional regulator [Nocardia sp. CA-135953]|uniref:helix-turn-helix transcriptional regulator n=1 Tax=Nocardia sp. CA-135953 TaxID=3239978 RepID=UPI003D984AC7
MLLGPTRLITLVGSGGIGKTTLAGEVLRRFQAARRVPIYWVRLARLAKGADRHAIEEEIAHSMIDIDFSRRSTREVLADMLTSQQEAHSVLVLDNCEHVIIGAGELIAELLDAVPGLTILATSREAIGWVDEHRIFVPPLTGPEALALFRMRAELAGHPLVGSDQIAAAEQICRHLHNNPLYIRLASARLVRQHLEIILREVSGAADDDRWMRWTRGARVGADERHRGVSDVITWSYELCSAEERLLFERLSVFAAGYDPNPEEGGDDASNDVGAELEAIVTICSDGRAAGPEDGSDENPRLSTDNIGSVLWRLVDQSLVTAHFTSTTVRYSMLESLRLFAAQRLRERFTAEVDESARLRARHRQYYRDKIVYAATHWFGPSENGLMDWVRAAWDNILIAIESSLVAPKDAVLGLEICAGLLSLRSPFFKGSFREIRLRTERALAAARSTVPRPLELEVVTSGQLVWIMFCQGRTDDAEEWLEKCVALAITDPARRQHWRDTIDTDIGLPPPIEFAWGIELMLAHSDARSVTVLTRAGRKYQQLGDDAMASRCELYAAISACLLGPAPLAMELATAYAARVEASNASWVIAWARLILALASTKNGRPADALEIGRAALADQLASRDQWGSLWAVIFRSWSLAQIIIDTITVRAADEARLVALATETAQLAGGIDGLRTKLALGITTVGPFVDEHEHAMAVARHVLGPDRFAAAYAQGTRLSEVAGQVQQLAMGTLTLDPLEPDHDSSSVTTSWSSLSKSEREVATLAAAGWTNPAIAARRGNSTRTIDAQLSAILQKLSIASRHEIINFVPADHMTGAPTTSDEIS